MGNVPKRLQLLGSIGLKIENTSAPGQTVIVKEVDEKGVPTTWEAIDRTHWVEGGMVEILPETTLEGLTGGEVATTYITVPLSLEDGARYTIVYNGKEYNCTAHLDSEINATMLGNLMAMGAEDTGEPFAIMTLSAEDAAEADFYGQMIVYDGSTSVTLSITQSTETVHKLPGKFLPDGVPHIESGMVEILPETQVVETEDGNMFYTQPTKDFALGETCVVVLDGVEYPTKAVDGTPVFGVPVILLVNADANIETQESVVFAIMMNTVDDDGVYGMFMPVACESATPTISIYQGNTTIHKLDQKLLPDALQFGDKEVDILPETELTFVENPDMGGMAVAVCTPSAMTIEDRNYIVTFGGVEYECAPYIVDVNQHYLGNTSMMDGVDNGMPFGFMVMVDNDSSVGMVISYIGETTAKVSVKGFHPVPIAEEYVPEPVFIDLTALGLGEVNNAAKVELVFSDADAKNTIEKQFRIAEKQGIIKFKFDYNIKCTSIFVPDYASVGSKGGHTTLPMIIHGSGHYYQMFALYEDNIIYVDYTNGTLSVIARRLTLATEV